jgi:hypothetical protein
MTNLDPTREDKFSFGPPSSTAPAPNEQPAIRRSRT